MWHFWKKFTFKEVKGDEDLALPICLKPMRHKALERDVVLGSRASEMQARAPGSGRLGLDAVALAVTREVLGMLPEIQSCT